jgi:hypothetical protein
MALALSGWLGGSEFFVGWVEGNEPHQNSGRLVGLFSLDPP